ncbi:MAG: NAD(P)-dependent oxidoreductase [Gemmatimonadetes bacterium]|nr:NAD(P)-dependent oxidoreductase [Gemmatimonadota bacterium]
MRLLITGGAGYIGSVTARLLLAQRHEVTVLDSLLHGGHALLSLYPDTGFSFLRGDVRSSAAVGSALDGVDAVIHLAAIVGDPACARQPELATEVNLAASLQLLELTRQRGVARFIFVSTCSNYGRMLDSSGYVTEDSELRPVSHYAETKVAFEKALLGMPAGDGPIVTILRLATVFGLSPRMRFDLTVNDFTKELVTKRKLTVYGEQFCRPYIHVRDGARAIAAVLGAPAEKIDGRVFNVGDTGQNYKKAEIVAMIRAEVAGDLEVEYVHKDEDPRDYRVSFEKIERELGFKVTRSVADGIREIRDAIEQGVITDPDNPCYRN